MLDAGYSILDTGYWILDIRILLVVMLIFTEI